ncbi:MAG TPA: class I SAM-dependent methyltransferase [Planctomycetota bacterium]|nr:class I SAM-dependent methyltransferase [Planctomycetota bacterium]HRR80677.1 class I SAM-dependent methyltransferase [Planctomycetota bacterium]HRT93265.1 class I SAM-dependent methyltransferase [Planctomycetota bacterium]
MREATDGEHVSGETQPSVPPFSKYVRRGAYHWLAFSRDPRNHDLLTAARYRAVLDAVRIRDGMSVLDVGSGDGALTYMLYRRNPNGQTSCVEPDLTGRALAAEMLRRKGASVKVLDALALVGDGTQDVVVCADVIEHVADARGLLADMRRVMRPNGRLVLSTPVRLTEFVQAREHVREFFPGEFSRLVGESLCVTQHAFCTSLFALDLYYWYPRLFLRRPVFRWLMSLANIWFGKNLLYKFNPTGKYWLTQVVVATRPLLPETPR